MDEKEICKRTDFSQARSLERIPVICRLIEQFWNDSRQCNRNVGFYYVLTTIILESQKKHKDLGDVFYWEEDTWYDMLQELIKGIKEEEKTSEITDEEKDIVHNVIKDFEKYWKKNYDLRFYQLVILFDDVFQEHIRRFYPFDTTFWEDFFELETGGEE